MWWTDGGVSGTSKTGKTYRYYYCFNQRKKKCSAKTARKDEIELRIEEIIESFLREPEMLASLAVDLSDHYKQTHGRGDEFLNAPEARRTDVEAKLANFVKAISQGHLQLDDTEAMDALEAQKQELDAAIQAEHVKATLYEDEASISAFYKRFAEATIDTTETRDQLFEYFVDKIYVGREQIVITSYYHDSARPIEFEDLEETLTSGHRAGKCEPMPESTSSTLPLRWRWGESNPRPTAAQQDFSGCSSLAFFSAPASHASKDADGLSR